MEFIWQLAKGGISVFWTSVADCPPIALVVFGYALVLFHNKTNEWWEPSIEFAAFFTIATIISAAASWTVSILIGLIGTGSNIGAGILGVFSASPVEFIILLALCFFVFLGIFFYRAVASSTEMRMTDRIKTGYNQLDGIIVSIIFLASFIPTYFLTAIWAALP